MENTVAARMPRSLLESNRTAMLGPPLGDSDDDEPIAIPPDSNPTDDEYFYVLESEALAPKASVHDAAVAVRERETRTARAIRSTSIMGAAMDDEASIMLLSRKARNR